MAKKTELEMDDVLDVAKKFVKAGRLDDLADTLVKNKEEADNPNQIVNLLAEVGQFIKDNDVEDKLEELLVGKTTNKKTSKKKAAKKKTMESKKSTKKTTTKKTTTKKTATKKKTTSTKKKTSTTKSKSKKSK